MASSKFAMVATAAVIGGMVWSRLYASARIEEVDVEEHDSLEAIKGLSGAAKQMAAREVARKQASRQRDQKSGREGHRGGTWEDTSQLPEGQSLAKEWIVMDLGGRPPPSWRDPWKRAGGLWRLTVSGGSKAQLSVSLGALKKLGVRAYTVDWHCVTGWSCPNIKLKGVPLDDFIAKICEPVPGWRSLMQVGADGYTANVHRDDAVGTGAFIAISDEDGAPLSEDHGGIRIVFPTLFGWKSVKFLHEVRFEASHSPGFWEKLGCNSRGRWAHGERWAPEASRVWRMLAFVTDQYRVWLGYGVWVTVMTKGGRALGAIVALWGGMMESMPKLGKMMRQDDAWSMPKIRAGKVAATPSRGRRGGASWDKESTRRSDSVRKARREDTEGDAMLARALASAFEEGELSREYDYVVRPGGVELLREGVCVMVEGKRGGRGVIECARVEQGRFEGKCRVVYPLGSVYHVPPSALTPLESGCKVIAVRTTKQYHTMARSQVCEGDRVFEIGCDFGAATRLIALAGAGSVCAVDISRQHVEAARRDVVQDGVRFEVMDAICDIDGLARLGAGCTKVFVDINGNREIDAVVHCVRNVQRAVQPDLIIVKSVGLAHALSLHGNEGGVKYE